MTKKELIHESNRQFIGAWRMMAEACPASDIFEKDGIAITNANVPLFIMNTGFLTKPLEDAADARKRASALIDALQACEHGWMIPVCEEWTAGEAGEAFAATLTEAGLTPGMQLAGMSAETLAPPLRPLPADLEIREVTTPQQAEAISDLNCVANGMPVEMGRASVSHVGMWEAPRYGYVGYTGGEAAAAGAVFDVEGVAFVGWMATPEAHRGKGYAEAIMRHALARAARPRTVLHATPMGEPVYRRMGYETHTMFTCWWKFSLPDDATA